MFVEEIEHTWDAAALPEVRDALDHLVRAAMVEGIAQSDELAKAREHLDYAGVEGVQTIAMNRRDKARVLHRLRYFRWLYRAVPPDYLVRLRFREIAELLRHGRPLKAEADYGGEPLVPFEDAYIKADALYLWLAHAPLRFRALRSFTAVVLGLVVAAGIIHWLGWT